MKEARAPAAPCLASLQSRNKTPQTQGCVGLKPIGGLQEALSEKDQFLVDRFMNSRMQVRMPLVPKAAKPKTTMQRLRKKHKSVIQARPSISVYPVCSLNQQLEGDKVRFPSIKW